MSQPVRVLRGATAVEAALLDLVGAHVAAVRRDPTRLARPARIVVPSRSLREHVLARVAGALGPVAGLEVETLRGLAYDVLRRAGEAAPGGDLLFPVLVRRLAAREPALRRVLASLEDGFASVAQSVGDLLDAGLDAAQAPALEEWAASELPGSLGDRLGALVRVAVGTGAALRELGLEHGSGLLRRARAALAREPGWLPSEAVWLHGWSDATGVATDLLELLVRGHGAVLLLDLPPSPGRETAAGHDPDEAGAVFTERLVGRLAGAPSQLDLPSSSAPPVPEPALFRAPGAEAEVREIAARCARLVEAGVAPESIGVVARELAPYVAPLRVHFARLGVPLSGAPGAAPVPGPETRPGRALLDLLRDGPAVPADRWLDAVRWLPPLHARDLRLALHALGAARLGDVAGLDLEDALGGEGAYRLPVRRGLRRESEVGDAGAPDAGPPPGAGRLRSSSRAVPAARLEEACARAAALVRRLEGWGDAPLAEHLAALAGLLADDLGWVAPPPGGRGRAPRSGGAITAWLARLETLATELPGSLPLAREELRLLLERAGGEIGLLPLGGAGGGVAVLNVTEARARTFEHLFVLGMNRDVFPRPLREDPLLPDAVRLGVLELLPDLPVKRRGFDEERYLLAQLCASAPAVTLSWQEVSDDGKERSASPLVVARCLARGTPGTVELVPGVLARDDEPLPIVERAVRAAREARRLPASVLEVALEAAGADEAADVAEARVRVALELDPPFERGRSVGPYLGFLGRGVLRETVHVTRLEALARCPWRTFLERTLRLEALPDARVALPSLDSRVLGNVFHGVLERVVGASGAPVGEALAADGAVYQVVWPAEPELAAWVLAEAREAVRAEGIHLPGLARVLARRATPYLERARAIDWVGGACGGVLGAELTGEVEVEGARVLFRVDRADRTGGTLRLTDYKSGSTVISAARRPATRRNHLLAAVAKGEWLQGAAYAAATAASGATSGLGRYLFAADELEPDVREAEIRHDDDEVLAAFRAAVRTLLAQLGEGACLPRLVDERGEIPRACSEWCSVREACLQHDSGARHRLRHWADEAREQEPVTRAERVARDAWWLGRTRSAEGGAS